MSQPEGFEKGNQVCRLRKSLYGLKQAPRQWNSEFTKFLCSLNLRPTMKDRCVFYSHDPFVIIAIYVDDGLIFARSKNNVTKVLALLKKQSEIHSLKLSSFSGFEIQRTGEEIFLHQTNYIRKVLANKVTSTTG